MASKDLGPLRGDTRVEPMPVTENDSPSPRFTLWETPEQLHQRAGMPAEFFVNDMNQFVPAAEYAKKGFGDLRAQEVFSRNTNAGKIRIVIGVTPIGAASMETRRVGAGSLRGAAKGPSPDEGTRGSITSPHSADSRVAFVDFIFDRKDVRLREALAAINEARDLCADRCVLVGFPSIAPKVIAEPLEVAQTQKDLASRMTAAWEFDGKGYVPGLEIWYRVRMEDVDLEQSPIRKITMGLVNAEKEQSDRMLTSTRTSGPSVLNPWQP